jgi:hypothetical protein
MKIGAGLLAGALAVLIPLGIAAASVDVATAAHAPVLDAQLSDAAWPDRPTATEFTDYQTKSPAPQTTRSYLVADDRNLYVAFVCERNGHVNVSSNVNDLRAQSVDFVEFDIDPS